MTEQYSICRMCLSELRISEMITTTGFSVSYKSNKIKIKFSLKKFIVLQIQVEGKHIFLSNVYTDLTGLEADGKDESPYVCENCQTTLKFSLNLRKAIRDSDNYLTRIKDKITAYEDKGNSDKISDLRDQIYSDNYCRLCLDEYGDLIEVFSHHKVKHGKSLTDIYEEIAGKSLESDGLSKLICTKCKEHLIRYCDARHMSQKNDELVKSLLNKQRNLNKKGLGGRKKKGKLNGDSENSNLVKSENMMEDAESDSYRLNFEGED